MHILAFARLPGSMRLIGLAVILAVGLTLVPLAAETQQVQKIPRVGMLLPGTPSTNAHLTEAFRQGLRELGYIEGQNILLEPRYSAGRVERFADHAAELSLARPGRNVTGLALMGPELTGKILQLLKEVVPKATRVGVLNLRGNTQTNLVGTGPAARALGFQIEVLEVPDPESLDRAFETVIKARVDALVVFPALLALSTNSAS